MAEDEEDDYMSVSLLASIEQAAPKPAVRKTTATAAVPTTTFTESEILAHGLAKPIDQDNVGFQMLSKLGYKPDADARAPIELVVKTNRMGVGLDTQLKESAKRIRDQALSDAKKRQKREDEIRNAYLQSRGNQYEEKKVIGQLRKARKVLANLNEDLGIGKHEPEAVNDPSMIEIASSESDTDDADQAPTLAAVPAAPAAQDNPLALLQDVVDELRAPPYLWCFWCAARYADEADMEANCPGRFEEDHE